MATLMGHLRCDNLKLREALVHAQREAEAATVALQAEQEGNVHLIAELERLRQTSDCIQSAAMAQSKSGEVDAHVASACTGSTKVETQDDDRIALENQLVSCKLKCAEQAERADTLAALVEHYEGQLRAATPNFKPLDSAEFNKRQIPDQSASNVQATSNSTNACGDTISKKDKHQKGKRGIKKWANRMFGSQSLEAGSVDALAVKIDSTPTSTVVPSGVEDLLRQREVIACLMGELEKANQKIRRFQKAAKQGLRETDKTAGARDI